MNEHVVTIKRNFSEKGGNIVYLCPENKICYIMLTGQK